MSSITQTLSWNGRWLSCMRRLGFRPEETFGLKVAGFRLAEGSHQHSPWLVEGKGDPGQNEGSMTQVVMHPTLAQALRAHGVGKRATHRESDWVFRVSALQRQDSPLGGCCRAGLPFEQRP